MKRWHLAVILLVAFVAGLATANVTAYGPMDELMNGTQTGQ